MKLTYLLAIGLLGGGLLVSCDKAKQKVAEVVEQTAIEKVAEVVEQTAKQKADALVSSMTGHMNSLTGVLEGVTDKASAEAAAAKIKQVGDEMKNLITVMETVKKGLSKEDGDALMKGFKEKTGSVIDQVTAASEKLKNNPEVSKIIGPVIEEFKKITN